MKKKCLAFGMVLALLLTSTPMVSEAMELGEGAAATEGVGSENHRPAVDNEKWDGYDTTIISTGEVFDGEEILVHKSENQGNVSITESEAYDAIWALAEEYPEGMPWTNDNFYWSYNLGGGGGCHGFALIVSDKVFGQNDSHKYTDYRLLRVGDVLRINNNSHTVVVLENHIDEGYIVVTEGNFNSSIHWGRRISTASLDAGFVYGYTRYIDEPSPSPAPDQPEFDLVRSFVSRMYTVALGRDAEEAGLNDWTNRLLNHETDGAGIAHGFIMSEEFKVNNVSDGVYVDILYRTFFDREADQGGRSTWMEALANGNSRDYVLAGFVNSVEFDNLCGRYGIIRGTMAVNETAIGPGVRQFVERCYVKVLNRDGEKAGVDDWTSRIARGEQTPESTAKNFFFSKEYQIKHTSNEEFVETLYQTFMDRASDSEGRADWLRRLAGGTSREEVLEGFSRSTEFAEIMRSFGL